ncbi:MAG: hypothetical protein HYZ34_03280 [Ignavibacteriae bacterium]|nr:hypothetical protein [Ignavibacteriota bacterium]
MFSWFKLQNRPIVIAHRGASAIAPENTLAAFSLALECNSDAIEFDVRLAKDYQVVVIHDATLQRTTNGRGKVHQRTLAELKQFSAGKWFDKKFETEKIPALQEVLQFVRRRVGMNIELKHYGTKKEGEILVEKTIQLITESGAEKCCLLSSFQHQLIQHAFKFNAKIARGIIFHTFLITKNSFGRVLNTTSPQFIFFNKVLAMKKRITQFRQQGLACGIYTINTEQELHKALRYGSDCIFTNTPETIRSFL